MNALLDVGGADGQVCQLLDAVDPRLVLFVHRRLHLRFRLLLRARRRGACRGRIARGRRACGRCARRLGARGDAVRRRTGGRGRLGFGDGGGAHVKVRSRVRR